GLSAIACPVFAASVVDGQPSEMRVQAENASTRELLEALAANFKIKYKLPANVNRNMTGAYAGSLRQVLAGILDGHDYVIESSDDQLEVVVLGVSAITASANPGWASAGTDPVVAVTPAANPHPAGSAGITLPMGVSAPVTPAVPSSSA